MGEKKEYKFKYIGKIVTREGETKDGKQYKSSMLQLGNRKFTKGEKKGEIIGPVNLSEEEEAKLKDVILSKDLYLFDPSEEAPDFIKKYVAVKTEDLKDEDADL